MESESNTLHLEQVVWPILPHQCMVSFHSTPQGKLEAAVDCNTDEMLVPVLDEFDKDLLNDMITKDNEFLDSYTPQIGEDFRIFKNVVHNDSGKVSRLDNSHFGVENLYEHGTLYPTAQRIQHEMKPKVKDTTAMYIDHKLHPQDGYIGIQVQANQMQVVKQAPPSSSAVYLQDVREETTVTGAKYYRKINQEASNGGGNNKLIFESVIMNTLYECENESIDSTEIHSGHRNIQNDESPHFETRQTFQNYNSIDKGKKEHACNVCNKIFNFKSSLTRHLLIHKDIFERSYACEKCNKTFRQKWVLKAHLDIHKDERPYKCGVCEKSFLRRAGLKKHSIRHNDERPHSCGICEKSFRRKQDLLQHSRIHTGEKPFVCNVCQKGFARKSGFGYHSNIHTGEKYGKSVTQRSNLLSHSKLHTYKKLDYEKPYACETCNKSFRHKSTLKNHLNIHKDERPHKCCICDKSFRQQSGLWAHLKLHKGEKPFVCDVCQKRFFLIGALRFHSYIHTGERPYECKICGKSFSQKCNLLTHSELHTDKKSD